MNRSAFTLIELLIVVAIIAILAAIAVPNFLEAQTRAKISAAKANIRTVCIGLEAYAVDFNAYPPTRSLFPVDRLGLFSDVQLRPLSQPIQYVSATTGFEDPFSQVAARNYTQTIDNARCATHQPNPGRSLLYFNYHNLAIERDAPCLERRGAAILSIGPDRTDSFGVYRPISDSELASIYPSIDPRYTTLPHPISTQYDPTNGTTSEGDIMNFVGEGKRFVYPAP